LDPVPFLIEVSQSILKETDQPDLVVDLADANGSASEHGAQIDIAPAEADTTAARVATTHCLALRSWLSVHLQRLSTLPEIPQPDVLKERCWQRKLSGAHKLNVI
jgi:hypothetical protein